MPGLTAETPARAVGRYQLDTEVGRLTPAERAARGKAARAQVPRDSHAVFDPPADRPDPIALLEQQAETRVPELVPVRWGRMMVSPFTYYRGAALPMGFNRQPHYDRGLLLVGDAGGMVNPFNGEGIAYAMESGELAAQVVAQALARPDAVGRERVIAGTDCGFGTFAAYSKVDPAIAFKKLRALAQGAAIASKRLWN